ncbi:MAG TPA: isoprenylcysteine carboxylmethyltransferase family protein [Candidatus Sulfotelmatobacter sp.]|jgi:protein-S-isoprenylcysteine O-methyltransferase Ste14
MVGKHIILTLVVGAGLFFLLRQFPHAAWGTMQIAGACLLGLGFVLWTVARFQLGSSFAITAQARHLVTHGLYSKIRNPIYVFGSCVIAGVILIAGHPIFLLIFAAIIPLQIWRGRKEAGVLEEKFGEQYRQYRARTWF